MGPRTRKIDYNAAVLVPTGYPLRAGTGRWLDLAMREVRQGNST